MTQIFKNVPLVNAEAVRKLAAQSVRLGAVTQGYPLNVEQACQYLNEALATEIMCVLRYRHHQIIAKGIDSLQVAAEFQEHAEQEENHMLMIAERINQLGGNPDFNPASVMQRTTTEYGSASSLLGMIQDDLVAERIAIIVYRKLIEWFGTADPTTRRILEEILKEEEDHANDLADLLPSEEG